MMMSSFTLIIIQLISNVMWRAVFCCCFFFFLLWVEKLLHRGYKQSVHLLVQSKLRSLWIWCMFTTNSVQYTEYKCQLQLSNDQHRNKMCHRTTNTHTDTQAKKKHFKIFFYCRFTFEFFLIFFFFRCSYATLQ